MGVVVADRAVDLAENLDVGNARCSARSRRYTTLASSLPRVVGEAVWPWVRDSIGSVGEFMRQLAQAGR